MATATSPKKATEARAADVDAPAKGKDTPVDTGAAENDDSAAAASADPVPAADTTADAPVKDKPKSNSRAAKIARGECVVDDGTRHMGRAVNGVICSAHAMRYDAHGNLRGAA